MGKCIIGEYYTATSLYVNNAGDPIDPDSVSIEVFYFTEFGVKTVLYIENMNKVSVGRYQYTFYIPTTIKPQNQIYYTMRGYFVANGFTAVSEENVDPFYPDVVTPTNNCPGVRVSFIKPR